MAPMTTTLTPLGEKASALVSLSMIGGKPFTGNLLDVNALANYVGNKFHLDPDDPAEAFELAADIAHAVKLFVVALYGVRPAARPMSSHPVFAALPAVRAHFDRIGATL